MNGHNQFKTALDNAIKQLSKFTKEIEGIRQQLEPEITEGQYWKSTTTGYTYKIKKYSKDYVYIAAIHNNAYHPEWKECEFLDRFRKLSDDEVEQALIKEAGRRGYGNGVEIKSLYDNNIKKLSCGFISCYHEDRDMLLFSGIKIYEKGKWAEIIEDEWEAVYDDRYDDWIVETNNKFLIMCDKEMTKEQAQAIANALNNLDND